MHRERSKTMWLLAALFVLFTVQLSLTALQSRAADNPHNGNNEIDCASCHQTSSAAWWSDQEANVCGGCHNTVNANEGTDVTTHRKKSDDSVLAQCTSCHDPHRQQQMRLWKPASYLYSGISDTIGGIDPTYTILTCSTATWDNNQWQNMVLVPNINAPAYNFRIASNTMTTITIDDGGTGENRMINALGGQKFAVVLGSLIKQSVNSRQVKFFRETGTNSFADGDLVADGICQVCHTKTAFFRNNATILDSGHPEIAGSNCMNCHNHQNGFKPTCTSCHGNPPVLDTIGGPKGLAKNNKTGATTGSTTAGAHTKHATSTGKGYACTVCHYNSAGSGTEHNKDLWVTLGFKTVGTTLLGGTYDGQVGVNYNTTAPTTTVIMPATGSLQCSNIYCHSNVQSGADGKSAPTSYATPTWTGIDTVVCGSCHKVAMDSGSHTKHLAISATTCDTCHPSSTASTHVNGSINMQGAMAYQGNSAPQAGFSNCTTASCHKSAYATTYVDSPVWGTAAGCGACHPIGPDGAPATGSHTKHMAITPSTPDCSACHAGASKGVSGGDTHNNDTVEVADGYSASPVVKHAPGNYTGTCSSASCHKSAYDTVSVQTPTWGTIAGCGACHPIGADGAPATGSHTKHMAITNPSAPDCSACHAGASKGVSGGNTHINDKVEVADGYSASPVDKHAPGTYTGTCSTAACHDNGRGVSAPSPLWGSQNSDCSACHATRPPTGSHTKHLTTTLYSKAVCGDCHSDAEEAKTAPGTHLNGNVDVFDSGSGDLGYPTSVPKHNDSNYSSCSTAYCHSPGQNSSGDVLGLSDYATVTWGQAASCGSCHKTKTGDPLGPIDSGSHTKHIASVGAGVNGCADCHTGAANDASAYNSVLHVNRSIDVVAALNYSKAGTPGNGYGQCSTSACHSDGKGVYANPTWGNTSPGCTFCHPTLSGKHSSHVIFTNASVYGNTSTNFSGSSTNYDFGCGNCHPVAAGSHMNGSVDISLLVSDGGTLKSKNSSPTRSGTGNATRCNGVYCHSDGKASPAFVLTPEWNVGFDAMNSCGQCHGNSPNTGAHQVHAVGIHFEDVYNGSDGKTAATGGSGSGAAHGDPAVSTTISCNICHAATLTKSWNKFGSGCNGCHSGDGSAAAIQSADLTKTVHVNGTPNVSFAAIQIKSRPQLRDNITAIAALNTYWQRMNSYKAGATSYDQAKATLASTAGFSGGSCSAVACHNGTYVSWTSTLSCDGCHTELPQ